MEKFYHQDIFAACPEQMKNSDVVFCWPPSNLTSLTRSMLRDIPYTDYVKQFFQYIDKIKPEFLYIVVMQSNQNLMLKECLERFPYVDIDHSYHHNRIGYSCNIIRCGQSTAAPHPKQKCSQETYISWLCKNVEFSQLADFSMRDGSTAFYAHRYHRDYAGMESRAEKIEDIKKRISDWDEMRVKKPIGRPRKVKK